MLGFPIRTSPDQRLVGDSPRLNAASHVLHRLLMPRHPPCALKNLATKMLASTMQISNNKQQPHPNLESFETLRWSCALRPHRQPGPASRRVRLVRFLRTQQCARNPATPTPSFPLPPEGGGTSRAAITLNRITSAPLVSCHPTTRTVMKDESAP